MIIRRKVAAASMLAGLATVGLMSWSTPAQAYTNPLDCNGGPRIVDCLLTSGGANEVWYLDDVHYAGGDGQDSIWAHCQENTWIGIYVEYTGGDGYGSAATSVYCGFLDQ